MARTYHTLGESPLIEAVRDNRPDRLSMLLQDQLYDVNAVDENGTTGLVWSVLLGHSDCSRLLLGQPGVDPNIANRWGDTAIFWASLLGRTEAFWLLLDRPDIDVNLVFLDGDTVLTILVNNFVSDVGNSDMLHGCLRKGFYFEHFLDRPDGETTMQLLHGFVAARHIGDLGLMKYFLETGVAQMMKISSLMSTSDEKTRSLVRHYLPPTLTQLARNFVREVVYDNNDVLSPVPVLDKLCAENKLPVPCRRELLMQNNSYFFVDE